MATIALVSGGGGSLGRDVAERLTDSGCQVVLTGRNAQKLSDVALKEALKIVADLAQPDEVQRLFDSIMSHFGQPPTLLAHCAGSVMIRPLHRTTPEQYRACLGSNLDSAFFTLQGFIKGLIETQVSGRAVLVSSIAARVGISNHAAVAAAKAGVEGLIRSVAATYAGQGLRINGVAPGMMRTAATEGFFGSSKAEEQIAAQYPLGRFGQVGDAAALICWLLSEEADWLTGQIIAVDGGFSSTRPLVKR